MKEKKVIIDILKKLEPSYDYCVLVTAFISLLVAVFLFTVKQNILIAGIDLIIAAISVLVFLFRKRISLNIKVYLSIIICLTYGMISITHGGFTGGGIIALVSVNVIAISLLEGKGRLFTAAISVGSLIFLATALEFDVFQLPVGASNRVDNPSDWLTQALSLTLFISVSTLLITSIQKMLASTIVDLRDKIEELAVSREEINSLAYYNQLTLLPNRYLCSRQIGSLIEISGRNACLLLFEISNYQLLVSCFGTEYTDKMLSVIGIEFRNQQEGLIVSHFSEDRFVVWASDYELEDAKKLAESHIGCIKAALKEKDLFHELKFHVAFSRYPSEAKSFEEGYQQASTAIKYAKDKNLNMELVYDENMSNELEQEINILSQIDQGIQEEEFYLCFQIKYNVDQRRSVGLEALARWDSKTIGKVSPAVFIPIITRTGQMEKFNQWIIGRTLDDFANMMPFIHEDITLSINISPIFFILDSFEDFIIRAIQERKIPIRRIIIELTEDVLLSNLESVKEKTNRLFEQGIRLSLDDFGTGFSSLNYLNSIRFQEIKIDKTFISNSVYDEQAYSLLKSIIALTKVMDYQVVAEGVETQEQIDKVVSAGCQILQGFYYSVPLPWNETIEALRQL